MGMNSGFKTTNENVVAWWDDKYVSPRRCYTELEQYGLGRIPEEVVNGASLSQLFGYAVYLMNELVSEDKSSRDVFMWVVFDLYDNLSEPKHKLMCELFWAHNVINDEQFGMDQRGELATLARELVKTWSLNTYLKMVEVRLDAVEREEE